MTMRTTHDLHRRRLSRNVGVGLVLAAFIVVIFGLTVAKVQSGASMEAFDHAPRASITVGE